MSAANRYFLNGIDMYTAYGFIVTAGSDSFLQFKSRKTPNSKNWPEQSGTEWDLSGTPAFEDREIKIKGYIISSSEADFWNKYNTLFAAFNTTGHKTLTISEFNRSYSVFYKDMPVTNRKTNIKYSTLIGVEIEIQLQEVNIPVPGGLVYFGYSSAIPTTSAAVKALPQSQESYIANVTLLTGLNRFFTIGIPTGKSIQTAFDQTANEDVTTNYLAGLANITIDTIPYRVYTMQIATPYTSSHTHLITLI